jgi:hypothetical protein
MVKEYKNRYPNIYVKETIEFLKTIDAHKPSEYHIFLYNLADDFMVSCCNDEFKI